MRVARGTPRERIGQSQRQRVRQYGDGVGAAETGGEGRHRRAQHVHVGVALRQHAPRGIGRDEQRLGRQPAGLLDPRPQQPQRAEFRQRQELVGVGAEPRIDHALRIFERNAGLFDRAQIGDAGGQHECQFLHFRSAGIMDHPSIGDRERALEAHRGEAFDRARDRGHDLLPAVGTGAPHRAGPERVEPEADVAGGGIDAFALDVFGDVNGGHPRLRADLKLDADAGVEIDAVENLRDRLRRRIEPETMGAIGAGEHQCQPGRAVLQIVQRLRVGRFRIGMIDPLHDLPGRSRGAAGDRRGAFRAAIDRIDLQPVGRLADQFLERRALQHPVDQLAPVLVGRLRKFRRQCQFVSLGHPAHYSLVVA